MAESEEYREHKGDQTLSLTIDQLVEYIREKKCSRPCEACGSEDWDNHLDDDGSPTLLATYSVRDTRNASWFYPLTCAACGHTRLIAAGSVWMYFFGRNAENG